MMNNRFNSRVEYAKLSGGGHREGAKDILALAMLEGGRRAKMEAAASGKTTALLQASKCLDEVERCLAVDDINGARRQHRCAMRALLRH